MIKHNNTGLKRKRASSTLNLDTVEIDTIDLTEDDATPVVHTPPSLNCVVRHDSPFELHSHQPDSRTASGSIPAPVVSQHIEKRQDIADHHKTSLYLGCSAPDTSIGHQHTFTIAANKFKQSSHTDRESNGHRTVQDHNHSQDPNRISQAPPSTSMEIDSAVTEFLPSSPSVMSTAAAQASNSRPATNGNVASPTRTDSPMAVLDQDTDMIDITPQRPNPPQNSELYKIPELATPFIPNTSMLDVVEYSNPQKFGLTPPFWDRWSAKKYSRFAEHLRQQFDPVPFAQEHNIPVEEVQHVFTSLVIRPLHDASEAAKRGEEGMQEIMNLSNKFGGRNRRWGRGGEVPGDEPVYGELAGIEKKTVVLTTEAGFKRKLRLDQLSGIDINWLQPKLLEQDKAIFWDGEAETETDLERLREKYGSRVRHWGPFNKDGKRLFGTMVGVKRGVIEVQTRVTTNRPYQFLLKNFVEADEKCLAAWLSMAEQRVLRAEEDEEEEG